MESQEFLLLVDDMLKYQDAGTTVADLRRVIRRMLEEESSSWSFFTAKRKQHLIKRFREEMM
tara:strand:+ start:67 stop:252 length:186 start_codon:yes stop_codon:yes gene_type:complete